MSIEKQRFLRKQQILPKEEYELPPNPKLRIPSPPYAEVLAQLGADQQADRDEGVDRKHE